MAQHSEARGIRLRQCAQKRQEVEHIVHFAAPVLFLAFAPCVAPILARHHHITPGCDPAEQPRGRGIGQRSELAVSSAIEDHARKLLTLLRSSEVALHFQPVA